MRDCDGVAHAGDSGCGEADGVGIVEGVVGAQGHGDTVLCDHKGQGGGNRRGKILKVAGLGRVNVEVETGVAVRFEDEGAHVGGPVGNTVLCAVVCQIFFRAPRKSLWILAFAPKNDVFIPLPHRHHDHARIPKPLSALQVFLTIAVIVDIFKASISLVRFDIGAYAMDFSKLSLPKPARTIIDPVEIFRRSPKPPGINDIYVGQAEVLASWHERREEQDIVIKLHTGGGKTLVGLLIARSILNETRMPVIYLTPTNQLVEQTLEKAKDYSISAVPYVKGTSFQPEFLDAQSVMVCNYHAFFNGKTKFTKIDGFQELGGIILDDAHVALSTVRDQFTLKIERSKTEETYRTLTNIFREDFKQLGKIGTFDDIADGKDGHAIIEVPYWSWKEKSGQVRDILRALQDSPLPWYFLRDAFDHCHALISSSSFLITPILPPVDLVPSFIQCPHRVFMSATIRDDSAIIRAFGADPDAVMKPIVSRSLAGVSERMILAPHLMGISDVQKLVAAIAKKIVATQKAGTVILVPSEYAAEQWKQVAEYAETPERVNEIVNTLVNGDSFGPYVFANRYDGIDLPGPACRLLILSGQPRGAGEYDLFRANVMRGGMAIHSTIAQRIEQGMGRAARGPGDWCVILIVGKDLTGWLSRTLNQDLLTTSTRAQLQVGFEMSRAITDEKIFEETILQAFNRDTKWVKYHAESLAELTESADVAVGPIEAAAVERTAFKLMRDGYFEKAIDKLETYCRRSTSLDAATKGWMLQLAARCAHYWEGEEKSSFLQREAYSLNSSLHRPKHPKPYTVPTMPGTQAQNIVANMSDYSFRRGYLAYFDEVVSHLVPEASANQFEQALEDLGNILGFVASRHDPDGPDVMWILSAKLGLLLEAKSRKKFKNALTKGDLGQLLVAEKWFQRMHPGFDHIAASVLPRAIATEYAETGDIKALTYALLNALCSDARTFFNELCGLSVTGIELEHRCEALLVASNLKPEKMVMRYLCPFSRG